jgi:hypothetical protein
VHARGPYSRKSRSIWIGNASLERLLDRTGKDTRTLLDDNRHFADEVYRLAALLEDRVPSNAIGQFVDSALIRMRPISKPCSWRTAERIGKFLLFARIPLDPPITSLRSPLRVLNSPQISVSPCSAVRIGVCDASEILRLIERCAARRKPRLILGGGQVQLARQTPKIIVAVD